MRRFEEEDKKSPPPEGASIPFREGPSARIGQGCLIWRDALAPILLAAELPSEAERVESSGASRMR